MLYNVDLAYVEPKVTNDGMARCINNGSIFIRTVIAKDRQKSVQ